MKMFSPHRQNPAFILINIVRLIREIIVPLILLLLSSLSGVSNERVIINLMVSGVILLATLLWSIFSWYRFTFYIYNDELRIEYGVLVKNNRFIPREHIQTINVTAGILQRLFGVVKVEIETAGGRGKPEATLAAISKADAEILRGYLIDHRQAYEQTDESGRSQENHQLPVITRTLAPAELLIVASTSGSIGIVLSFLSAVFAQIDEFIPKFDLQELLGKNLDFSTAFLLVLILVLLAWLLAVVGTVLKYWNFTVRRTKDKILITTGLLERRELTIPLKRVQAIRVVEGLLRQPFGFASLVIVSAGYGLAKGESAILFPLIKTKAVNSFLNEVAPEFVVKENLCTLPQRAQIRYIIKAVFPALLISIPVTIFVPFGYMSIISVFMAFGYGVIRFRDAAWTNEENKLLIRYRKIARTTAIIPKSRIQSVEISRSVMQRRKGLSNFRASVISGSAGTGFSIVDLNIEDCEALLSWAAPGDKSNGVQN